MAKLITEEEVEKLLAKKRRTPEEKEQLKYRKILVKIEKQGKVAFVARQAIVEGLLFSAMGFILLGGWIGAALYFEDEKIGPKEMPALILMCGGWACFVLVRVVYKMIQAIKLILGDFKMYEQYIKTGEINEELAVSNAERLLKKAGHGIAVSFGAIIITVGAFVLGIVSIVSGIYGVFISDKEYTFPVSILFMLFMYGVLLFGIISFGWGCYMVYAFVSETRKYLSRKNHRKQEFP